MKDAVDLARAGAQVSIDLAIVSDLWSAEIDIEQISQALHNILLNARQAMPEEAELLKCVLKTSYSMLMRYRSAAAGMS